MINKYRTKRKNKSIKKLYPDHEKWAQENGYRENDRLNSQNTTGFKNGAER